MHAPISVQSVLLRHLKIPLMQLQLTTTPPNADPPTRADDNIAAIIERHTTPIERRNTNLQIENTKVGQLMV